jgi:hypothetical protein
MELPRSAGKHVPHPDQQEFDVRTRSFGSQADSWSLVLYDESFQMRHWIGSSTMSENTVVWQLPPATYSLSLRYYTDGDDIEVPAVVIDGSVRVVGGKFAGEGAAIQTTSRDRSEPKRSSLSPLTVLRIS